MILSKFRSIAAGDVWGGMAAMLVAFPAAIGFGVTVYAAIGPSFAPIGAVSGIVGTVSYTHLDVYKRQPMSYASAVTKLPVQEVPTVTIRNWPGNTLRFLSSKWLTSAGVCVTTPSCTLTLFSSNMRRICQMLLPTLKAFAFR